VIAVDTNLICYFYLHGEYSSLAEKSFQKDPLWVAPFLWRSEFRNILTGCIWRGILKIEDAVQIMSEAERLMEGNEYVVPSQDILRLAASRKCSAYDCEFVALAKELGIPLVTMDKKILKDFPETAVSLDKFVKK